jgi:hypothetical protein
MSIVMWDNRAMRGWLCCALFALSLTTSSAAAQQSIMIEGVRPELHLGIGWGAELGVGVRVDIPVVPSGFIDSADDEFALSPGGEVYFDDDGDGEIFVAGVFATQWNFYLDPEWSIFPELGLALVFGDHGRGRGSDDNELRLRLLVALGGRYHWSTRNALVLRLSWPFGLQIGITF